jgi:NAD-dependent deacetylase
VHSSLAELEKRGKLVALVTQNIDGLHQRGGSEKVLELHGNSRRFLCQACEAIHDFEGVRKLIDDQIPPLCPACGEAELRPDVVLFGEALPHDVLNEAFHVASTADVILVVGSSLVVQPAASLPLAGVQAGARLVVMNIDPTPIDGLAELVIRAPADAVLPNALSLLEES